MKITLVNKIKMIPKKWLLFIGILFFTCFGLFRIFNHKKTFVDTSINTLAYPFVWSATNLANYFQQLSIRKASYKALVRQHKTLQSKFKKLQKKYIQLASISHFEKNSKPIVEFARRYTLENAILSKVLLKKISPNEHSFILNRGSNDGVKKNMVAVYKLQIVGKIQEVFPYYSKLLLITDKHSKVAAFTNETDAHGIVHGSNDITQYKMKYVTLLSKLINNDLVFSSGQGLVFPEGFCLGKIIYIGKQENSLYHDVSVSPLVDLKTINYCLLTDISKINLF